MALLIFHYDLCHYMFCGDPSKNILVCGGVVIIVDLFDTLLLAMLVLVATLQEHC